ncbi:MAG TPA: ankyrin repeat domain-containing protein, partial [Stellaceae bacterium]|nr:ankyrin repeat domain-containing protein [Stellaceae bacterium]
AAGDARIVALLLERGAPVDPRQQGGFTPLMSAAARGDREIAELLLDHGADPYLVDEMGLSAIDHALKAKQGELAGRLAACPPREGDAGEDHQPAQDLMPG